MRRMMRWTMRQNDEKNDENNDEHNDKTTDEKNDKTCDEKNDEKNDIDSEGFGANSFNRLKGFGAKRSLSELGQEVNARGTRVAGK